MVVLGLPKLSDFIVRLFYLRLDYLNALFNLLDYFLNGACRSGNLKRFKQEESKYTVNLVHLVTRSYARIVLNTSHPTRLYRTDILCPLSLNREA